MRVAQTPGKGTDRETSRLSARGPGENNQNLPHPSSPQAAATGDRSRSVRLGNKPSRCVPSTRLIVHRPRTRFRMMAACQHLSVVSKRNGILAALGLNVRQAREAKDLTQEKLAEKAGLDPTYISGIERGLRNPGIARIAKALALTTAELCKGVDA